MSFLTLNAFPFNFSNLSKTASQTQDDIAILQGLLYKLQFKDIDAKVDSSGASLKKITKAKDKALFQTGVVFDRYIDQGDFFSLVLQAPQGAKAAGYSIQVPYQKQGSVSFKGKNFTYNNQLIESVKMLYKNLKPGAALAAKCDDFVRLDDKLVGLKCTFDPAATK